MKKAIILFLSIFVFYACVNDKANNVDKDAIKNTINTLLVNWRQPASDANFDAYLGKIDSSSLFTGTAAAEVWTKTQFENFSKLYFDKGKAWSFETLERAVYLYDSGGFVWFDDLLSN